MRYFSNRSLVAAIVVAVVLAGCRKDPGEPVNYGHWGALDAHEYSLSQALVYAIQDEHLAQGEYEYVIREFGSYPPFNCIVGAEGAHIRALEGLFAQRGESVPPNRSPEHLIAVRNMDGAYEVGVEAEEMNIAMYNLFLSRSDLPDDVRAVFTSLRNASMCHRNAFSRRL